VDVVRQAGLEVTGMAAIFTYGFSAADKAFSEAGVPLSTLTDYSSLIELATTKGIIPASDQNTLLNWRQDPGNWAGL
jgi:orotate phosphoribosyltransferase